MGDRAKWRESVLLIAAGRCHNSMFQPPVCHASIKLPRRMARGRKRGPQPSVETRRAWPTAEGHQPAAVGEPAVAAYAYPQTASRTLQWFLTQLVIYAHLLSQPEHDFPVVHLHR